MAFLPSLADQAEASCPICVDLLRDTVTPNCGHNFCCSCITQCWENLQDILPCPVCLHHCLDRNFKKNCQLGHVAYIVKQIPTFPPGEARGSCGSEKLNQILAQFCDKDLELLCHQCRISSDHRDHHLMPIEQAAARHRKRLKSYIEPLKKHVKNAENQLAIQVTKSLEFKRKMTNQREELYCDFEQIKRFLGKEQDIITSKLQTEEKDAEKKTKGKQSKILRAYLHPKKSTERNSRKICAVRI